MSSLTDEQKARMEENRRKAMEIRAAKMKQQIPTQSSAAASKHSFPISNNPTTYPKKTFPNTPPGATPQKFYSIQSSKKSVSELRGDLTLISEDRFELNMAYHQTTIDALKKISGREYDSVKKNWNFPLAQYNNVLATLKNLNVLVGELSPLVISTFLKRRKYPSDIDLARIHPSMRSTLMDFQIESVRYAVSRGGRVLIADDMGLGKTIQALAIADYYRNEWPLLIVCPSSMRFQWVAEIHKHLMHVSPETIFVITTGKDALDSSFQVIITSYDLMAKCKDKLLVRKFGVVIMDESHSLKNPKAIRTKVGTEILKKCSRCVLLSGTPALSRPVELHCQLQGVKPQTFNKFMEFGLRYCDGKMSRFGWDFTGSSHMTELSVVLKELLMIRRLKADVLAQLPPKRREVVILESSGKSLSETSEFAKALQKEGLKGLEKQSTMFSYFMETGLSKINGVVQYICDMLDNGEKFLVFAHHAKVLDAICNAVESKKTDYIRIDGSVPSDVRKQLCNHFQEQESCQVAVLSIKAANTGLTLTAARLVIFAELYWNPGDLIQAEDRAHRIGQADSVLVQYLIQEKSVDDIIWPLIQDKLNLLNKAGLCQDKFAVEQVQSKKQEKVESEAADYFLPDDDAVLAELNLDELENSFEMPEKKPRFQ
ncbi:SWI/SNF-related matrix-associated actin-dependent regulator of chromatin subfamily A-like protein 1 [Thrips palmi]|uniref:SWI/SNF-related matrix-associated actin-dependent regulator of chromatin subfamily A-like protein 1 n=1 Tax=Thrips palmi TaxID=161013 RepID=A0A6P8ZVM4_THRPL|nr:SWI/SNF-related matrix-associated actin-dependent regulator of chromatin subfamily A-like protein 1 [Thrips palmi]